MHENGKGWRREEAQGRSTKRECGNLQDSAEGERRLGRHIGFLGLHRQNIFPMKNQESVQYE
jgi:hypothetical protein